MMAVYQKPLTRLFRESNPINGSPLDNIAIALCCSERNLMSKLRVHFSISIDGFGAGPNQDLPESGRSWRAKLRTLTQPLPKGEENECKQSSGQQTVGGSIISNMIDEKLLGRITANPEIFGGKPIIRGMRISVEMIRSLLARGEEETILADYPDLEPDDLRACLAYAHAAISHDKLESLQIPA